MVDFDPFRRSHLRSIEHEFGGRQGRRAESGCGEGIPVIQIAADRQLNEAGWLTVENQFVRLVHVPRHTCAEPMTQEVEISLRVPNMKVRPLDEHGYPIDHSSVRFKKIVLVPVVPKPGDSLQLTTASGTMLRSTVQRADWNEERGLFVVACRYSDRSISADEYSALVNDPDWQMRPRI